MATVNASVVVQQDQVGTALLVDGVRVPTGTVVTTQAYFVAEYPDGSGYILLPPSETTRNYGDGTYGDTGTYGSIILSSGGGGTYGSGTYTGGTYTGGGGSSVPTSTDYLTFSVTYGNPLISPSESGSAQNIPSYSLSSLLQTGTGSGSASSSLTGSTALPASFTASPSGSGSVPGPTNSGLTSGLVTAPSGSGTTVLLGSVDRSAAVATPSGSGSVPQTMGSQFNISAFFASTNQGASLMDLSVVYVVALVSLPADWAADVRIGPTGSGSSFAVTTAASSFYEVGTTAPSGSGSVPNFLAARVSGVGSFVQRPAGEGSVPEFLPTALQLASNFSTPRPSGSGSGTDVASVDTGQALEFARLLPQYSYFVSAISSAETGFAAPPSGTGASQTVNAFDSKPILSLGITGSGTAGGPVGTSVGVRAVFATPAAGTGAANTVQPSSEDVAAVFGPAKGRGSVPQKSGYLITLYATVDMGIEITQSGDPILVDDTLAIDIQISLETLVQSPYSRHVRATKLSPSKKVPLRDDLEIVRGDQVDLYYLWNNVVYTEERPLDSEDRPMYHSSEMVPNGITASPTALVAPWSQTFWHAEIRNTYLSSIRTFNGWVPWYGRRPDWTWWQGKSLVGFFTVETYYDAERGGTVTHLILPSLSASNIRPGGQYYWDLESAKAAEWNEEVPPKPIKFTALKTRVSGKVRVDADWTLTTPIA